MSDLIPLENLAVKTIDELAAECGMFYDPIGCGAFGRYGCKSEINDAEGECHTFGCPIAQPMDDEDVQWEAEMEDMNYMLQHSEFKTSVPTMSRKTVMAIYRARHQNKKFRGKRVPSSRLIRKMAASKIIKKIQSQ